MPCLLGFVQPKSRAELLLLVILPFLLRFFCHGSRHAVPFVSAGLCLPWQQSRCAMPAALTCSNVMDALAAELLCYKHPGDSTAGFDGELQGIPFVRIDGSHDSNQVRALPAVAY